MNQKKSNLEVIRSLGIRGLYKGLVPTVLYHMIFSGLMISTYSYLKCLYIYSGDGKISESQMLLAGAIAGCVPTIVTTPIDVLKTNIQAQTKFRSFTQVSSEILRKAGYRGFLKVPNNCDYTIIYII